MMRKVTIKHVPATHQGVAVRATLDDGQTFMIHVTHAKAVELVSSGKPLKDYVLEAACEHFGINPAETELHGES